MRSHRFYEAWLVHVKVKLQGTADDKLDGKIGVLRKLDAATGKFEVALVDEARIGALGC